MTKQKVEEKIVAIENGLKPRMQIEGQVIQGMNILERMRHFEIPSVSIAMVNNGEVEWAKTYNLSSDDEITMDTLIQAGSISKPVAAVVALKLVELGVLNLDQDVNEVLKTWKLADSEFTNTEKVTLRRLLSHTAGLTVHGFAGYPSSTSPQDIPTLSQVLSGESPANSDRVESERVPSTKCVYSGGGTEIMQKMMEDVTGRKLSDLANELVFQPLGMTASTYELILPSDEEKRLVAVGHMEEGEVVPGKWHVYPESAAAGLWTTPSDLARFIIGIQNHSILSEETTRQMLTRQVNSEFGLGPMINEAGNDFSHGGVNEGFNSQFIGFANASPNAAQGAVIMINSSNGMALIPEIIRGMAEVYDWPATKEFSTDIKKVSAMDPSLFQNYIGKFEATLEGGELVHLEVVTEHEKLFLLVPFPLPTSDPKKFELLSESDSKFFTMEEEGFDLEFSPGNKNEISLFGLKAHKIEEPKESAPYSQAQLVSQFGLHQASKSASSSPDDQKRPS